MDARRLNSTPALLVALTVLCLALFAQAPSTAAEGRAESAFEQLKTLAGSWEGTAGPEDGEGFAVQHRFQVTAGGSVVLETLFAGSDHEMLNVYRLEDGELVLTHFCDSGNQPEMKLDPASPNRELRFVFTGGENLDPGTDAHIHGGRLLLRGSDHLESEWEMHIQGKLAGTNRLDLRR
jgi:hypothetical protein